MQTKREKDGDTLKNGRNRVAVLIPLLLIPAVVLLGAIVFKEKYSAWVSLSVAVLSLIPLFCTFERKESSSRELMVLAVMIAISVVGRFVFAWLPGFKPVTAIAVITAMYLGKEAGFVVGSISAVVSNFYFGQGPWTPFQMLAWGSIGFLAGAVAKPLKKHRWLFLVFGAAAGVLYSLIVDIWTTVWADGGFNFLRYAASVITALPTTVEYAVSNVIFLLLLSKPIGEKLERIKKKYGLFAVKAQNLE